VTREELEHAIRAACDIAQDDEIYILGSQAILGQFPEAPAELRQSAEVDVSPRRRVDRVDAIDGAIGELSTFHRAFGFYVHGLPIEAAKLPSGWKRRVVRVRDPVGTNGKTGLCLEAHDLAASKLAAFRDKDRSFVRVLLRDDLVKPNVLRTRIRSLPLSATQRARLDTWLEITAREIKTRRR
jgi:hypothetical protein